jgi:hypothetical protein
MTYVDEQAIVEKLRQICPKGKGLAFAKMHGISQSDVSEVLSGKRRPSVGIIAALGYDTTRFYRKTRVKTALGR